MGEILGLTTTDSKELLAFLQNLSSKEIVTGLHNALTDEVTNLLRDKIEYRPFLYISRHTDMLYVVQ